MNVFELTQIEVRGEYPLRDTSKRKVGIYSTLEKACEAMRAAIAEVEELTKEEEEEDWSVDEVLGYSIRELRLDGCIYGEDFSIRTYTRQGELNAEMTITDDENYESRELAPFYGRPEETIRFKRGDIVEVCWGGDSELSIVCHTPCSTKKFEEYKQWWNRPREYESPADQWLKRRGTLWDYTDDSYLVYSLGEGDTHSHPEAPYVFAPTKEVPLELKLKLQEKLKAMIEEYGHNPE